MRLSQLGEGCLKVPSDVGEVDIRGLTSDSRDVEPGFLFVAVPGEKTDGHRFAARAEAAGALAIVGEKEPRGRPQAQLASVASAGAPTADDGRSAGGEDAVFWTPRVPYFRVSSSRRALAKLGANFYGRPQDALALSGVTGTKGKTTTAWILDSIARTAGKVSGLLGTVKNRIAEQEYPSKNTTPSSLELQRYLHELISLGGTHAVLEVSSHGIAQERIAGLDFRCAVLTNIAPEHLDYHGTFESYREVKTKFFLDLRADAFAVLPREDGVATGIASRTPAQICWYGADRQDGVERLRMGPGWLSFVWKGTPVRAPVWGAHNLQNVLAAMAAAECLGFSPHEISQGVEAAIVPPGRLEEIEHPGAFRIFVDYAHTDGSLDTVLGTLRTMTPGRLITVFGCGGDRDREKRPRMGRVAEKWSDQVIVTSDNPRTEDANGIIEEVGRGLKKPEDAVFEPDRREAIALTVRMAREGDVILIAGKGHETYQEVGTAKLPFDDRAVAREFLLERIPLDC